MKQAEPDLARLVIDIGPLREEQFTGIPNVVKEVARRALAASPSNIPEIEFAIGDQTIHRDVVARTVEASSGRALNEALLTSAGVGPLSKAEAGRTAALNLHVKSPHRRFGVEAVFFHDLSFLSMPTMHQAETVRAHVAGFRAQIDSTDIFFTNSNATALELQWYCGVSASRIEVAHLGHDIAPASLTTMRGRLGSKVEPFLLVLGTIEPRKNIKLLLTWLGANPSVLDDYRVIVCGREGWGDSFHELVAAAGMVQEMDRGRIKHVGFTTADQRLALLVSAQALVFPSLYEGFGLPALEAMACGTPVLASCSTSIPEVVGPDGFYFDPRDATSLQTAFKQFCKEKASGALKKRVDRLQNRSAGFSYDLMFDTIIAGIFSVAARRSARMV